MQRSIVIGGLQRVLTKVAYNRIPSADASGRFSISTQIETKSPSLSFGFLTPKIHESSSSANRAIKTRSTSKKCGTEMSATRIIAVAGARDGVGKSVFA